MKQREDKWLTHPSKIKDKDKVVLFLTDQHFPYSKLSYLKQIKEIARKWGVNTIVFGGDMVDNHCYSRHQTHPEAVDGTTEMELAKKMIKEYAKVFPYAYYVSDSNHDKIPQRRLAELGMPESLLKPFREAYNLPDGWIDGDTHFINGWLYEHGHLSVGGVNGTLGTILHRNSNVATGHLHGYAEVRTYNTGMSQYQGLRGGCLIDPESYAFAYGKGFKRKPIIAVSVIDKDQRAYVIPLKL